MASPRSRVGTNVHGMLNGRLYRVAFAPFALALAVAAFSLTARPGPLTSTLAPTRSKAPRRSPN